MNDYIKRSDAVEAVWRILNGMGISQKHNYRLVEEVDAVLDEYSAADVVPVVRAVWRRYSPFTDTYECSNCGEQVIDQQFRTNFCPNCGAEMEES